MKKLLISLMIVTMALMGCVPIQKAGKENAFQGVPSSETVPPAAPDPETIPPATPGPETIPQAVPSPAALGEQLPEAVKKSKYEILAEQPPALVPGAEYVYKRTNCVTGDYQIFVSKIKSKLNWMGTPAYIVELSIQEEANYVVTSYLVINTNLNTLATLDKDGKLLQAIKGITSAETTSQEKPAGNPCIKIYDWPLTLGKNFTVEYEVLTKPDNKTCKVTDQVSVDKELELVKIALGEWTTFRIQRITPGSIETHYYAPEIGIEIKQEISQTLDNSAGAGVFVVELIGYNIPGVGQVGQEP